MPALHRWNRSHHPALKRGVRWMALLGVGLAMGWIGWSGMLPLRSLAQPRIRTEQVWQQIYQQLPDLPLENQYVNDETGEVSTSNTLLNRLIRYHIYVKGRPTFYRLDWKLTLSDYLGANERILPETYPSGDTLRTNPLQGDITAISSLTRQQREALVDLLVSSFNPAGSAAPAPTVSPAPSPAPAARPSPAPAPRFPQQPRPGDAQLLQP